MIQYIPAGRGSASSTAVAEAQAASKRQKIRDLMYRHKQEMAQLMKELYA